MTCLAAINQVKVSIKVMRVVAGKVTTRSGMPNETRSKIFYRNHKSTQSDLNSNLRSLFIRSRDHRNLTLALSFPSETNSFLLETKKTRHSSKWLNCIMRLKNLSHILESNWSSRWRMRNKLIIRVRIKRAKPNYLKRLRLRIRKLIVPARVHTTWNRSFLLSANKPVTIILLP